MQPQPANKTFDLLMKLQYVSGMNNGKRGVIFGTGTPISNNMSEVFVMMKYLAPQTLTDYGIPHFDEFARLFADIYADTEINASGEFKSVSRFQRFMNLPELTQIFGEVADIKLQDDLDLDIPKLEGEKPIEVICQPAPEMDKIMQEVSDNWDQAAKDRRLFIYYWMMKRSAIDVRLVDPSYGDWEHSKINKTVKM